MYFFIDDTLLHKCVLSQSNNLTHRADGTKFIMFTQIPVTVFKKAHIYNEKSMHEQVEVCIYVLIHYIYNSNFINQTDFLT